MNTEAKVTSEHLQRDAYLYIRQSTLHQVLKNTESTDRQYALQRRAVALGWRQEQVVVIDHDQGQSGASAVDRAGFQRLVADVGLGKVGVVMGLEVSRLARNCADWHRLLEICALTHTLILDEDGVYDPVHYNDRMLLGLKGTMSEGELHYLKARLQGGVINKAQRGELKVPLPIGLVYGDDERVELDPDQQVQQSLRVFFATFARTGSAWNTICAFGEENLKFPRRASTRTHEIVWQSLTHALALRTLHNPRYAGVFCFGRTRGSTDIEGKTHRRSLPQEQWRFVKKDAHPGYITWDEFLSNQKRLCANFHGGRGPAAGMAGPAREGPALLQGLALCGKCGGGLTVRYHRSERDGRLLPHYVCQKGSVQLGKPICQRIAGSDIDQAVGKLLVERVTPLALEAVLGIQQEIQARLADAARLRQQQVHRAQYEADQARIRFMRVDPNNRLVADNLEASWNEKLRVLAEATQECEKQEKRDAAELTAEQKNRIHALASEFPKLWLSPNTLDRDRKRMTRLLLEDVTLRLEQDIVVQVRFKGGAAEELRLPPPKRSWEHWTTKPEVVQEIDRLLDDHTETDVATILNQQGRRSGGGHEFTLRRIKHVERAYKLRSRCDRLRQKGWMTIDELAALFQCHPSTVRYWRKLSLIPAVLTESETGFLYMKPSESVLAQIRQRQQQYSHKPISA